MLDTELLLLLVQVDPFKAQLGVTWTYNFSADEVRHGWWCALGTCSTLTCIALSAACSCGALLTALPGYNRATLC